MLGAGHRAHCIEGALHDLPKRNGVHVEAQATGDDARKIQQVFHESRLG